MSISLILFQVYRLVDNKFDFKIEDFGPVMVNFKKLIVVVEFRPKKTYKSSAGFPAICNY
jgi:hypothetical protein